MSDAKIDFRSNPRLIPDDARLKFGTGNDTELVWSTADAGNHSLVLALGDSNHALHVTDVGAVATDWNVAADTHPALYIHSDTTPATDYLKIGGHDGTNATIDLVGGTTLKIAFDGSAEIDISATALSPSTDGGNALGTTSLGWNGLHLNTGTAINWENGDVTLTHADGKVTWAGDGAVLIDFGSSTVDINGGAIDGTTIGAAAVAAGSFAAVIGTTGTFSGILKTDDATASTSITTGALVSAGGLGVAENFHLGGQSLFMNTQVAGSTKQIILENASTTPGSRVKLFLRVDGTDGGDDPYMIFERTVSTNKSWSMGLDNSNTTAFVWSHYSGASGLLGTNDRMRLTTAGVLSVDGDGGGSDDPVSLFDDDDDAVLAQSFAYAHPAAPEMGLVSREQWQANRELMVEKGLCEWAEQESGPDHLMYNIQPMMRMLAGGIYQTRAILVGEVTSLRQELAEVNRKLKAIGA